MNVEDMLQTLGWAIRLLRYYRAVPNAVDLVQHGRISAPQTLEASRETVPPQPAAPTLPSVGDTFAGEVTAVDESAVLVAVPGFADDRAIGVMKAESIDGGRTDRYRVGNRARVEVTAQRTLRSGRVIVELKPAKRQTSLGS
jgi:ribosomal protein S1